VAQKTPFVWFNPPAGNDFPATVDFKVMFAEPEKFSFPENELQVKNPFQSDFRKSIEFNKNLCY